MAYLSGLIISDCGSTQTSGSENIRSAPTAVPGSVVGVYWTRAGVQRRRCEDLLMLHTRVQAWEDRLSKKAVLLGDPGGSRMAGDSKMLIIRRGFDLKSQ
jgi:hypothetical protein